MSSSFLLLFVAMALLLAVLGEALNQHRADMDALLPPYVDAFGAPTASIRVSFPEIRRVMFGMDYRADLTQDAPGVLLLGPALTSGKFYSLITVDPDAPSPARPVAANVLHFLVANIPGSISPTEDVKAVGDVVNPWMAPQPPTGTHRYMFLLFDQMSWPPKYFISAGYRDPYECLVSTGEFYPLGLSLKAGSFKGYGKYNVTPFERSPFSVRNFSSSFNLGFPVGGTLFRVSAAKNLDFSD